MKWTNAAGFVTLASFLAGCSGEVITPGQSSESASGSGSGGASPTATASGTGGAGGFVASTGTGNPHACNDASVFVDIVGDGANQHFAASCAPEAHLTLPGGAKKPPFKQPQPPGGELTITTCSLGPDLVLVLSGVSMSWPASIDDAVVIYTHDGAEYDAIPGAGGALEVFTFEPVGGVVEGAFTAKVVPKNPAGTPSKIQITGKFRVCRGPDWVPV